VGDKGQEITTVDGETFLEAFLNMSLRSAITAKVSASGLKEFYCINKQNN
jgi:hypothetical protein